jgi:hypothetical protein
MSYYCIPYETAVRRLTNRWNEQVERYPLMRQQIPLMSYIRANAWNVMRYGQLEKYDQVRS